MRTLTPNRVSRGLAALKRLDLSQICRKIQEPAPEGKGWTPTQTAQAELWYRRYLELCLRYPTLPVVPNFPIDMMWHQHILDTRAYGTDCDAIFGEMLHHYPYFGLNGDAEQRDDAFDVTNELYRRHFGEDCTAMTEFVADVPEDCTLRALTEAPANCNSGGSGTGCGQGCSRGGSYENAVTVGQNCGHGGGGTGCGQGCSRGGGPALMAPAIGHLG